MPAISFLALLNAAYRLDNRIALREANIVGLPYSQNAEERKRFLDGLAMAASDPSDILVEGDTEAAMKGLKREFGDG